MGDKTKIEWSDALLPVATLVAADAEGDNVEPVGALVAEVMMVVRCLRPAVEASLASRWSHPASLYRVTDGVVGTLAFRRCSSRQTGPSLLHATAVDTPCAEAVAARPIHVELLAQLPRLTGCASLEASRQLRSVLLHGQPGSRCRRPFCSGLRSHDWVA